MENLFKIKPIENRTIDNVESEEIWIPKVSSLNDPYDCALMPYLNADLELDVLDSLLHEVIDESELFSGVFNVDYYNAKTKEDRNWVVYQFICEQIRNIGVCSFINSPLNLVTWSHYGDNHKGMCLEYARVEDQTERFIAYGNGYRFLNVSYMNLAPKFYWEDFLKSPELALRLCLGTKYKDWAYENETRLVTYYHAGGEAFEVERLGIKLVKVYLGCEVEETTEKKRLESVCAAKGIPVINLKKMKHSFGLVE